MKVRAQRRILEKPLEVAKQELRYKQKRLAALDYLKRINREELLGHELVEKFLNSKGGPGLPTIIEQIVNGENIVAADVVNETENEKIKEEEQPIKVENSSP